MEADLKISSEDTLILPKYQNDENNDIEKNKIDNVEKYISNSIIENIKNNGLYSQVFVETDYYLNFKKINSDEYKMELNCSNKIKEEVKIKISDCMKKEQILNSKKEEFKKMQNDINIDEKLLEKKLISTIGPYEDEFDKIIEQIAEKILDYESFSREAMLLQEKLIKYRSSLILQLCFKIYWRRLYSCIIYIAEKYIIFLYNEKIFNSLCKIIRTIIKIIVDDIHDKILKKISDAKIFLKYKEDYKKKIQIYKELSYFCFIFNCFDKENEKNIFNIDKDLNLDFSENIYDNIRRFNYHILKRTGLNISLDLFKERINIDYIYATYLSKTLLLYQKYKIFLPVYKKGSFLYD